jgi:oligoribonuclease NrnB/cAMP/cGMP phosphodiesterase (DHH superfamily)
MRVDAICYVGQRPAKMVFKFNKKATWENSFQYKGSNFQKQIIRGFNQISLTLKLTQFSQKKIKCSTDPIDRLSIRYNTDFTVTNAEFFNHIPR